LESPKAAIAHPPGVDQRPVALPEEIVCWPCTTTSTAPTFYGKSVPRLLLGSTFTLAAVTRDDAHCVALSLLFSFFWTFSPSTSTSTFRLFYRTIPLYRLCFEANFLCFWVPQNYFRLLGQEPVAIRVS
jgi:hypothetical protein